MFKDKLLQIVNNKNHFTVDINVLKSARQMNLDTNSLILLIYLINGHDNEIFDYKKILNDLGFNEKELLESISTLKDKKLLSINMKKNNDGILEERLNLSSFYEILVSKILDEDTANKKQNNLYDIFEKEFGRTLSPIEYDIINNWLESKISEELIIGALKEAVFNGVNNLRYIDKILFEWNKKGVKSLEEVSKIQIKKEMEKEESFYEYDWLNE